MDKVSEKHYFRYSIILPIYKIDEGYLRLCLNSLLNGITSTTEILLIDDNNNSDICGRICDEYAEEYSQIIVFHQVNQGVSVARNTGMFHARGEYIIFVDPDDWVSENFYQEIESATQLHESSDIILFSAFVNYKKSEYVNQFWNEEKIFRGKEKEQLQLQLVARGVTDYFPQEIGVGVPWGRLYRREFLEKYNLKFFPELRRMQDNIFNMYAFQYANEIVYLDLPVYHYRKILQSATNKKNNKVIEYFDLVNIEVEKFIEEFNKGSKFNKGVHIKRLMGINSYYRLYFKFANTKTEKKVMQREFESLFNRKEYAESLKKIDYSLLSLKEKIFVSVLKLKSLRLFALLQFAQSILDKLTGKDLN